MSGQFWGDGYVVSPHITLVAILLAHGSCTIYQGHESPDSRVQEFVSCGFVV